MNALNHKAFNLPLAEVYFDVPAAPRRISLHDAARSAAALLVIIDRFEEIILEEDKEAAPLVAQVIRQFAQQHERDLQALAASISAGDAA